MDFIHEEANMARFIHSGIDILEFVKNEKQNFNIVNAC